MSKLTGERCSRKCEQSIKCRLKYTTVVISDVQEKKQLIILDVVETP